MRKSEAASLFLEPKTDVFIRSVLFESARGQLGFTHQYQVIPEFPSFLVLPLLMTTTVLAILLYKRRREKRRDRAAPSETKQFWRSIKQQAELEAHAKRM
jgi:hypothetical protein